MDKYYLLKVMCYAPHVFQMKLTIDNTEGWSVCFGAYWSRLWNNFAQSCNRVVPPTSHFMASCTTTLTVAVIAVLAVSVRWLATVFTFYGI